MGTFRLYKRARLINESGGELDAITHKTQDGLVSHVGGHLLAKLWIVNEGDKIVFDEVELER